jgi:putative CocE/NonD family hydrolase
MLQVEEMFNPAPTPPAIDFAEAWRTLPYIDMLKEAGSPPTDFEDFVSHEPGDPWWDHIGYVKATDRFDVPALHVNSWYDIGVGETLKLFNLLRDNAVSPRGRDNQYAIISPTDHCTSELATSQTIVGEREVGDARLPYWDIYLNWFDHWLRRDGQGTFEMPKLQYYLMGANEWRTADSWPVEGTEFRPLYLHSDGHANTRSGDGRLSWEIPGDDQPADVFTYDPDDPVPSIGGPVCCTGTEDAPAGGFDQRSVEDRDDVLIYTSERLSEGIEVTGPIEAVLHVSSSARDTDFVVKLVDVYPDGRAMNVQEGILRARYREGYDRKVWMEDEGIYQLRLDLQATSNFFAPGHRIRVEVTSSSFPRWDRNLNTGGNNYDEVAWVVAENRIHHTATFPSHVVLPVVTGR